MLLPTALSKKPNQENLKFIFDRLDLFHVISDGAKQELIDKCFEFEIAKHNYLLKKGDCCYHLYFIIEGVLTGQATSKAHTITSFISVKGELVTAIEGIYGIVPATEDIRAEEDSLLMGLHVADLEKLTENFPEVNILMRKVTELYYKQAHYRSVFFRIGTASDKYADFLETYPHHASRIPLDVAASFLNIKINTLKKIVNFGGKKVDEQYLPKTDIEAYMELERPFLQKKLSLTQLAGGLKLSTHNLSYLLNLYFNQNFSHFINSYRVNFVLSQLADQKSCKQYSLDGLGTKAGFSSRSTFFNEFKRHTGVTPYVYLKQLVYQLN